MTWIALTRTSSRSLYLQLLALPEIEPALQTHLGILTPDMERAIDALQNDDDEEFELALDKVVPEVDSIDRRMELARAVIALRNRGCIPPKLAAAAVIELDLKESMLFRFSVAESLEVLAAYGRSPTGLTAAPR